MRRKIVRSISAGKRFKREFRRQIRMLIIVTFGFTVAFSWRQTVFDTSQAFVSFVTDVKGSAALSILTSLFITIVAVLLVYLTAHLLKDGNNDY